MRNCPRLTVLEADNTASRRGHTARVRQAQPATQNREREDRRDRLPRNHGGRHQGALPTDAPAPWVARV